MASFDEDLDRAIRQACLVLAVNGCKDIQRICLEHLLSNRDVFACLPTGYGTNFIFQACPIVWSELARVNTDTWCENSMVFVVSPLNTIMEDQVETLQSRGVADVYTRQDPDM